MHSNFLIIEGFWDGLDVKYVHSGNAAKKAVTIYVANAESCEVNWLSYIPKKRLRDYLLISFTPFLLTQLFNHKIPVSDSPFIYQLEITNPSILHLAHLLQSEIQTPKTFSQEFVFAIVTAMIRYCEAKKSAEVAIMNYTNGVM